MSEKAMHDAQGYLARSKAALDAQRERENDRSGLAVPSQVKSSGSPAGRNQKPARMPTTKDEFSRLSFAERAWLFCNRPSLYERFTRR